MLLAELQICWRCENTVLVPLCVEWDVKFRRLVHCGNVVCTPILSRIQPHSGLGHLLDTSINRSVNITKVGNVMWHRSLRVTWLQLCRTRLFHTYTFQIHFQNKFSWRLPGHRLCFQTHGIANIQRHRVYTHLARKEYWLITRTGRSIENSSPAVLNS